MKVYQLECLKYNQVLIDKLSYLFYLHQRDGVFDRPYSIEGADAAVSEARLLELQKTEQASLVKAGRTSIGPKGSGLCTSGLRAYGGNSEPINMFFDPKFDAAQEVQAELIASLGEVVREMQLLNEEIVKPKTSMGIYMSGLNFYDAGGYMNWHTNEDFPGYRLYMTWTEEAGKSFFRYQDPLTKKVCTSVDEIWTFRIFPIHNEQDRKLWHCVYSETRRASCGFNLDLSLLDLEGC